MHRHDNLGQPPDSGAKGSWLPLRRPGQGRGGRGHRITERLTGMSRATLSRRLVEHARAGRAVQVIGGRWRTVTTEEPPR